MKKARAVTLRDVAERAGVGPAAASVVINGAKSGTRVSDATRAAILSAAEELNYRPNVLARSLRRRRTGIIGVFSGYQYLDPRNEYIADILSGLQQGCRRHNLDLLLYTPHASHAPDEIVCSLADGRMDGLVVTAGPEHPIVGMLAESHLPVVAVSDRLPGIPCVLAEAYGGGQIQARHLFDRGHRKVLYLPGDYPFPSVLDRYRGFHDAAAELGLEVVDGAPVCGHAGFPEWERERHLGIAPVDMAYLEGPNGCTAVQCWDDGPAYRVASQLSDAGYAIPGDVAVMGYNGCTLAIEPRWKLTTVAVDWPRIGATAVDVLHAYIEGADFAGETVLPVRLVQGATT